MQNYNTLKTLYILEVKTSAYDNQNHRWLNCTFYYDLIKNNITNTPSSLNDDRLISLNQVSTVINKLKKIEAGQEKI